MPSKTARVPASSRQRAFAVLLALPCLAVHAAAPVADPDIDGKRLSDHVRVLASDAFEGRAPGTPGEEKTVAYLIEQMRKSGLKPGGPGGAWTQDVPLVRSQLRGPATVTLQHQGKTRTLRNGEDLTVQTLQPVERIDLVETPLVFVGYGIDAPELGWNDFKDIDLRGRIAVVLINDPDFETDAPGKFDGRALTYYGRWTYKYEELARRGAAGALIVHETAPAAYGWKTVQSSGLSPLFDIERSDAASANVPVRGWMQRELVEGLFEQAGLDFEAEKKKAQTADFRPLELPDTTLSIAFDVARDAIVSKNVIGKIPGSKHPDESVVFSAHWDAYGVAPKEQQSAGGDPIRHGAIDNATGVAAVLELGRVFAARPAPQRSMLFIALTAEEKGLLGAVQYVARPVLPLEKTAAVFNIEMLSPDGPTRDIASWGKGDVSLERDLAAAAEARGRTYSPDPNLEAGFFFRADHFAFARAGVPAITVGAGLDRIDGGVASGRALRDAYFATSYHQPGDAWSPSWNVDGQVQDVTLLLDLGSELANSRRWPSWSGTSPFGNVRRTSEASRARDD